MRWTMIFAVAAALASSLAACGNHGNGAQHSAYFSLETAKRIPATAPIALSGEVAPPVFEQGAKGAWDDTDVLNPSVIMLNGQYLNYYSGFHDKVWSTGLAVSSDGVHWSRHGSQPVLSPGSGWAKKYIAANGSAIIWKRRVLYFYQGMSETGVTMIGLATSPDGHTLTPMSEPVLRPGTPHTWDGVAVGDPYAIMHRGEIYLYYLGMDEHGTQRLGVAKSLDGVHWVKYSNNPVLDVGAKGAFDEHGLGEPSVAFSPPYFYMLYTGRNASEYRDIGYAISSDGVSWRKMSIRGLLGSSMRSPWDSKVACDTTILRNADGTFTVWYGGGDIASPDENLHGKIGMMRLSLAPTIIANGFDANFDYAKYGMHSSDVLHGSWDADGSLPRRSAWVGIAAHVTIWNEPDQGQHLEIDGWIPTSLFAKAGIAPPIKVAVDVNGRRVATRSFTGDDLFKIQVDREALTDHGKEHAPFRISITPSNVFVPSTFTSSHDARTLSLKLSKVALSR